MGHGVPGQRAVDDRGQEACGREANGRGHGGCGGRAQDRCVLSWPYPGLLCPDLAWPRAVGVLSRLGFARLLSAWCCFCAVRDSAYDLVCAWLAWVCPDLLFESFGFCFEGFSESRDFADAITCGVAGSKWMRSEGAHADPDEVSQPSHLSMRVYDLDARTVRACGWTAWVE